MSSAAATAPAGIIAAERDGIPMPRRYWAHLAIGLAITMSSMDGSIANIALPTFVRVLNVTPAASIWVVNAYQLSVCMSLLIIGALGDIYGYDRIFRICLALFTAASLGCALSHNLAGLSVGRFFQGIGGAGILGVTNAMLRGIYPQRELARGIGYNTMIVALSLTLGPTVASLILSIASWPWLFAVNVPIGIFTLIIARRALPSFPRSQHRFDLRSAGLSAATFAMLILSIAGLGQHQSPSLIAGAFFCFLPLAAALIRRQRSIASPLLPIDLLRIRLFSLSVGTTFMASMAQLMGYVAIPFLFHQLGRSLTSIGLLVTPWPVMVAIIAPFAGRLARRFAPRPPGQHRPADPGRRPHPGRHAARRRRGLRYLLAHAAMRARLRNIPAAEFGHPDQRRAENTQRRRQRHGRHLPRARPGHRRCPGRRPVRPVSGRRRSPGTLRRRRHRQPRRRRQPLPHYAKPSKVSASFSEEKEAKRLF